MMISILNTKNDSSFKLTASIITDRVPVRKGCRIPCRFILAMLCLCLVAGGCASLAAKSRMAKFSEIAKSYQRALELSDYHIAAKFVDSSAQRAVVDIKQYANIKIVRYEITNVDVADDERSIEQDVELQYFLLNQNRMKTINDHQVWQYREQDKVWRLQSGLPQFKNK